MKLAEKKVIWNSSNTAPFESVIQSKGESSINVNDADPASIPSPKLLFIGNWLSAVVVECYIW
jgi:hypothetical protein